MTPNFDPEKAKYTLITNISFVQRDGADRLRLDCHALLVVEEGIEKRMSTAINEFETYVAFSLQTKGLEHLASQAPRLAVAGDTKALPETTQKGDTEP